MEEKVVLTAELNDKLAGPLTTLENKVKSTAKTVESSAKRQSTATRNSSKTIMSAIGDQERKAGGLARVWGNLKSKAATGWNGAKNTVVSAGEKIKRASRQAGEESGDELKNGFTGRIKGLLAGAVAAFGVQQLAQGMTAAVSSFSELEDSSAAASVIFGKNMTDIIDQSKTAGAQLGLSEQAVINAANTFGTYGKAAGLSGKDLSGFSTDLTTLAGDMASFKGTSTEQAIEAVGAALRGETEPIRAYGVMLDDASLREEAFAQGIISSTKEALTPQNKILAAQALIFKQTADAQGDFARTSESTANVQKTLAAETENLRAKLGGFLAPAFTAVRLKALDAVRGVSGFLDKITEAKKIAADGGTTGAIAKALGLGPGMTTLVAEALGSVNALKAGMKFGFEEGNTGGVAGYFMRIGGAIKTAKDTVRGVWAGFMMPPEVAASFGANLNPLLAFGQTVRTIVDSVKAKFSELAGSLNGGSFAGIIGVVLLVAHAFGQLSPMLLPIVGLFARFGPVVAQLGGALRFLLGPIGLIAGLFIYAYSTSEPFRAAINGLLGVVMNLGMTLMSALLPVLTTLMTTLLPVLSTLFMALVPIFIQIVMAIIPIITTLVTQLVPVFMQLITGVLPIVTSLLTMLVPVFISLLGAVTPIIPPIVEIIGLLLNLAMEVISPLMPLITTIAGLFGTVLGGAIKLLMPIITFLLDKFTAVATFLLGPLSWAIEKVSGLFSGIGDLIGGITGGVGDFLGTVGGLLGLSGGGVLPGFSGGGVVHAAGGLTLPGYSPGVDSVPAMLSPGESVLVPELTRSIGPQNIMAANREASGGRPAGAGPALTSGFSAKGGSTQVVEKVVISEGAVQVIVQAGPDGLSPKQLKQIKKALEQMINDTRRSY